MRLVPFFAAFLLLAACSPGKPNLLYEYENYARTLYSYKKAPSDATREAHLAELDRIIAVSAEKGKRVPPGIWAERAYFLGKAGKGEEALKSLDKEKETYPESAVFVDNVRNEMKGGGK